MHKSQQRAVLYSGKILPITGQNVGIHNDVKFLFTPKSHPNHETPPWFYGEWYTKVSERHKRRGEERISDAHSSDPITLQTKDLLLRKGKRPAQGHPAGESQELGAGNPSPRWLPLPAHRHPWTQHALKRTRMWSEPQLMGPSPRDFRQIT